MEFAKIACAKKKVRMAMKNNSKTTPLLCLIAIFVVFSLLSAILFDVHHKKHEEQCQEENCPICLALQIIHNTKIIGHKTDSITIGAIFTINLSLIIFSVFRLVPVTLVKQKVKLVI